MADGRIDILVLGGTRLRRDEDEHSVGGPLPRGLLAALALESGRPVSLDRITALLWSSDPPSGLRAAVQQLATRVRRSLAEVGAAEMLRAEAPGYLLALPPEQVDLLRFRDLMRSAAAAGRAGDAAEVVALTDRALALWTGPALADLADLPIGRFGPHLDDERWRAEELRAEHLIADGRPEVAASHLSKAVTLEPLRERLWVLAARALLAADRPGEATRVVRTAVAIISAELGVAPGPDLSELAGRLGSSRVTPATEPAIDARRGLLDGAFGRAAANEANAARQAMDRYAFAEAAHRWRRVLDLLPAEPGADNDERRAERADAFLGLGAAHNEGGQEDEACSAFLEAAAIARRTGDGVRLARAAVGFCSDRVRLDPGGERTSLLREALAALDAEEHGLRAVVLARLACEGYWTEPLDRVRTLAAHATAAAARSGDAGAELHALHATAYGHWEPDRAGELLDVCRSYLDAARRTGDRRHELLARRWLVPPLVELGHVAEAGDEAGAAIALADDLGLSVQQWVTRVVAASHAVTVGELERAEALTNEALALGALSEPETALDYVSIQLWIIRWVQGRLGEIAELVEAAAAAPGVDVTRRLGLAGTHAVLGRPAEAHRILERIGPDGLAAMHVDSSWYMAMAAAAECVAEAPHEPTARAVARLLAPYRDRIGITSIAAVGPIAHHLASCHWAIGEHDVAIAHMRHALGIADRHGLAVFGARSAARLATWLSTAPDAAARSDARTLAARAADVARQLGLSGVSAEVSLLA